MHYGAADDAGKLKLIISLIQACFIVIIIIIILLPTAAVIV